MRARLLGVCLAGGVLLAACSGGGSTGTPSSDGPVTPVVTPTGSTAPPTSGSSGPTSSSPTGPTSGSPTSSGQLPVDRIPPGNPASWVPAGVPTTAKYKEPGDQVPMFRPVMFQHTVTGARAMAVYYIQALNWSYATLSATSFSIICGADSCRGTESLISSYERAGEHPTGSRASLATIQVLETTNPTQGEYAARMTLRYTSGAVVAKNGKTIKTYSPQTLRHDVFMKWNGHLWTVVADYVK